MRFLGLDYGDKTIGVAVSDPLGSMALGLETIRRKDAEAIKPSLQRLGELIEAYKPIGAIVLGFPKNMDNTEGERCAKTLAFKARLERNFKKIPVVLWDERLSTLGASRTLSAGARSHIDEMAAVFILQGYMDSQIKKKEGTVMKDFEALPEDEGLDMDDGLVTMFDEEGNESCYQLLVPKNDGDILYILAEERLEDGTEAPETAEVVIFKCVEESEEADSMVFDLMDEGHEDFEKVLALFKEEFEELGIEY